MTRLHHCVFLLLISFILLSSGANSATFTVKNQCTFTIWPGILSNAGTPQLATTGFTLQPDESTTFQVPTAWSGRLWGRTLCSQDPTTSRFICMTGDCGSNTVECSGGGAAPPATLAEFTLDGSSGLDFYDVSLVDGYNLPMMVSPQGGSNNCTVTGCSQELNDNCPNELKVTDEENGESVACKSACDAFGDAQYCCSGAYGTPDTCKPSSYSEFFKSNCPRAYSYAYDDGTSTFTCANADYAITFCPSWTSSLPRRTNGGALPQAANVSAGNRNTSPYSIGGAIAILAVVVAIIWISATSNENKKQQHKI